MIYAHIVIFMSFIVVELIRVPVSLAFSNDEVSAYNCRLYVTLNTIDTTANTLSLIMIGLLIYMTQKICSTPLHDFWQKI